MNLNQKYYESISDFAPNMRQMYKYAQRKHDDTHAIRKGSGKKYFVHPEAVAKLVMEYGGDDDEVKAAFAHDLVEDAGATIGDIKEKFGQRVASLVKELTNDTYDIKRLGKEKYMDLKLENLSPSALMVKLCDILHNSSDFPTDKLKLRLLHNIVYLQCHRNLEEKYKRIISSIEKILRGD